MSHSRRHPKRRQMLLGGLMSAVAALSTYGVAGASTPSPSGTITVWSYLIGSLDAKMEQRAEQLFQMHYPDVKVDYVSVPFNNLDTKLLAAAAVHTGPDVVIDNPVVDFPELSAAGALANMDPYLAQLGRPLPFPSSVVWKVGGKVETIQAYVNFVALWYNNSILQKLHLSVPHTQQQLAYDLSVVTKHGYQGLLMDGDPGVDGIWQLMPWLTSRGLTFCSLRSPSSVPVVASVLSMIRNWVQRGWIPKDFDTFTQITTLPIFLAGKAAFMENGNWNIESIETKAHFDAGVVPMPSAEQPAKVLVGGEGEAVGGYSSQKSLAWHYLQYGWFSPQGQEAILNDIGSLPTRNGLESFVAKFRFQQPFLAELHEGLASWPYNKEVDTVATDLGNIFSSFAGGSGTPMSTAQTMRTTLIKDLAAGGGSC